MLCLSTSSGLSCLVTHIGSGHTKVYVNKEVYFTEWQTLIQNIQFACFLKDLNVMCMALGIFNSEGIRGNNWVVSLLWHCGGHMQTL